MKTFGCGNDSLCSGTEQSDATFHPLILPEGTYFKQITQARDICQAVDNNGNLWHWRKLLTQENGNNDDASVIYELKEGETGSDLGCNCRQPRRVKWFSDNDLKVLDVKGERCCSVVKC